MFLGYNSTSKAYRLWSFDKQCLITNCDVIFDEDSVFCRSSIELDLVSLFDLFPFDHVPNIPITLATTSSNSQSMSSSTHQSSGSLDVIYDSQAFQKSVHESFCEALPTLVSGSLIAPVYGSPIIPLSGNSISFSGSHDSVNNEQVMSPNIIDCLPSLVTPPNFSTSSNLSISHDSINNVIRTRPLSEIYSTTNPVNINSSSFTVSATSFDLVSSSSRHSSHPIFLLEEPKTVTAALKSEHANE